jgi:hypothetical protein
MEEVFGGFALSFSPFVEIWLEKAFVELSHASESSSTVEEVKLFVVFLVDLFCLHDFLIT